MQIYWNKITIHKGANMDDWDDDLGTIYRDEYGHDYSEAPSKLIHNLLYSTGDDPSVWGE